MWMKTEWDPAKARANRRKHGVDFADAAVALEDQNALTVEDNAYGERRYRTLALGPQMNVLLVVFSLRGLDRVRIISARRADRSETREYWSGIEPESP
jgi:uncharacterized DUF497 family protein